MMSLSYWFQRLGWCHSNEHVALSSFAYAIIISLPIWTFQFQLIQIDSMFNFNLFDPFMSQYQPIKYSHTSSCQLFEYRTKNPLVIFRCTHLLKIIGIKGQTLWRNVNFNFDASWNLSAFDTPISQTRRQTNHPTKRSSKLDLVKHELWLFLFGLWFFFPPTVSSYQ